MNDKPSPAATAQATASDAATALVFNRSTGTFRHGDLILKPNAKISVPVKVAEMWRKLSGGLVTSAPDHENELSEAGNALRLETERRLAAEDKIVELNRKLSELEALLEKQTA